MEREREGKSKKACASLGLFSEDEQQSEHPSESLFRHTPTTAPRYYFIFFLFAIVLSRLPHNNFSARAALHKKGKTSVSL